LSRIFLIVSSILLIINSSFIAFSKDIIHLLNPAYAEAFFVVVVMLFTSLMNSYRIIYMAPLAYNTKYIKAKSMIWVVAGLINIILNFFLIPKFGIYAACLNSLVTYTITFLLMLYFSKKAFYIKYDWVNLLKIVALSAIYALTILLDSNMLSIIIKILLFLPYTYICFKYILNVDVINIARTFIKNKIKN
jgi:O-antigen/teichoic acid export membrane protein